MFPKNPINHPKIPPSQKIHQCLEAHQMIDILRANESNNFKDACNQDRKERLNDENINKEILRKNRAIKKH